jgi:hypothetical protein
MQTKDRTTQAQTETVQTKNSTVQAQTERCKADLPTVFTAKLAIYQNAPTPATTCAAQKPACTGLFLDCTVG